MHMMDEDDAVWNAEKLHDEGFRVDVEDFDTWSPSLGDHKRFQILLPKDC